MTTLSAAEIERYRLRAVAKLEERKRDGTYEGEVQPHVEYQTRPLDWIVEKLGVPENTLRWSLNPGYKGFKWDGDKDPIVQILEGLARGEDVGVESATGTGKSQPIDEPVFTPEGWKPIGKLQPGDFVIGRNGKPTEVLAVYPQGILPVYRLTFSDGASTRACGEHLWAMRSKADDYLNKPYRILSTIELMDPEFLPGHGSWRVPLPRPIDWTHKNLPIDPYVLGLLLGDGSYKQATPRLTTKDEELVKAIEEITGLTGVKRGEIDFSFYDPTAKRPAVNPLMAELRKLGLHKQNTQEKAVPPEYFLGSVHQRLSLLQGLMDSDGTVKRGRASFSSTSINLADAVQFLARSLGGVATKNRQEAWLNGERHHDAFSVRIRLPKGMIPFRLRRKIAKLKPLGALARTVRSITPDGEVECVCIRVAAANSLYVTNDFIVTHNTFIAACTVLWFLACWKDSIVVSGAPKSDQLLLHIWKEIGALMPKFHEHFPQAELLTGKLRMKPEEDGKEKWAATAFVCGVGADEQSATKAQGFHAPDMLIITEETPGIHTAIMAAFSETRTDDHNLHLALGNPDHRQDQLHVFCEDEWVNHLRISAFDHPNIVSKKKIVPGAIGPKRLAQRIKKHGKGSRLYLSRVRGISPAESEDALIKWDWCVAAAKKYNDKELRHGEQALGVDVANSPDGDKGAKARWLGACLTEVEDFHCPDANLLGKEVFEEARDEDIDPRYIGVDDVGVGAGCVNEIRRLGMKVRYLSGGRKAVPGLDEDALWSQIEPDLEGNLKAVGPKVIEAERFDNLRSQVWWRMREDLRKEGVALPYDEELFADLTTPTYTTRGGKICVETKKEIIKRLKRSPNKGDATCYGNFVRRRSPLGRLREVAALVSTSSRDYGLEQLLGKMGKEKARQNRQFQRDFKRLAKRGR